MYKSVLQVEWLGDEHAKQKVWGSSVGGRVCFLCKKLHDCVWGLSWYFLKIIPYFQPIFSGFLETTSLSIF